MKKGVITDCFKKPLEECLAAAGRLGFDGVQIYATTGTFSPENLTAEQKERYKKLLKENTLVVSALCGDLGGHGFELAEGNAERVEKTKRIVDPVSYTHLLSFFIVLFPLALFLIIFRIQRFLYRRTRRDILYSNTRRRSLPPRRRAPYSTRNRCV